MPRLYIDGFREVLTVDVANGTATSIVLPTGAGAKLAALTLSASDYLVLRFQNGTIVETMWATARSGDTLTVLRAQEGTGATPGSVGFAFIAGSIVRAPVTAVGMRELANTTASMALLAQVTDQVAVAGYLKLQARTKAGFTRLEVMGPSGVDYALQPAFHGNRIIVHKPGSGTAGTYVGLTPTIAATASHPAPTFTTTLAESLYRMRFACSTTAGNSAGIRDGVNTIWRGGSAGRGGFFHNATLCSGSISLSGGEQAFCLTSQTATLNGAPSALPDVLGIVKDAGDTNWQFARRTGTGAVQKVSLGVAPANHQVFELTLYCAPNSSTVFVRIIQWAFDGTSTTLLDTSYTTDLPAATTGLGWMCHTRNAALASANNIEQYSRYTFSDF
jgi:hypothetical protein